MVVKYNRAQRRHDRERLRKKRQYYWGYGRKPGWIGWPPKDSRGQIQFMSARNAGMIVDTPTPCSCYMCGNPRRKAWADEILTIQERKAFDNFRDEIHNIYHNDDK